MADMKQLLKDSLQVKTYENEIVAKDSNTGNQLGKGKATHIDSQARTLD